MIDYLHRPVCHEAFFKKYASKKFLKGKHRPGLDVFAAADGFHSVHFDPPMGQEVSPPVHRQLPLRTVQLYQGSRINMMGGLAAPVMGQDQAPWRDRCEGRSWLIPYMAFLRL